MCEAQSAVRNFFIVLQNRLEARHLSTMGSCSGKLKSVNLSTKLYFPLWFPCNLAWWRCSLKVHLHCKIVATIILAKSLCSGNVLNTTQQKTLICVVVWGLYFHCILVKNNSFGWCLTILNSPIFSDQSRRLFSDHDASSIRVPRHQVWHDWGVRHPEIAQDKYPKYLSIMSNIAMKNDFWWW